MLDLDQQPYFVPFVEWSSHCRVAKRAASRQSDPVEVRGAIKVRAMAPASGSHPVQSQLMGALGEHCSGDSKENNHQFCHHYFVLIRQNILV